MNRDIIIFCRSCDRCQKRGRKVAVKRVPMEKIPIITEPFLRVSIDIVEFIFSLYHVSLVPKQSYL